MSALGLPPSPVSPVSSTFIFVPTPGGFGGNQLIVNGSTGPFSPCLGCWWSYLPVVPVGNVNVPCTLPIRFSSVDGTEPLSSWLSFNPQTMLLSGQVFSGLPPVAIFYSCSSSLNSTIIQSSPPIVLSLFNRPPPLPTIPLTLGGGYFLPSASISPLNQGRAWSFTFPTNLVKFGTMNSSSLSWNASWSGGGSALTFFSANVTFSGTPQDSPGTILHFNVTATDPLTGAYTRIQFYSTIQKSPQSNTPTTPVSSLFQDNVSRIALIVGLVLATLFAIALIVYLNRKYLFRQKGDRAPEKAKKPSKEEVKESVHDAALMGMASPAMMDSQSVQYSPYPTQPHQKVGSSIPSFAWPMTPSTVGRDGYRKDVREDGVTLAPLRSSEIVNEAAVVTYPASILSSNIPQTDHRLSRVMIHQWSETPSIATLNRSVSMAEMNETSLVSDVTEFGVFISTPIAGGEGSGSAFGVSTGHYDDHATSDLVIDLITGKPFKATLPLPPTGQLLSIFVEGSLLPSWLSFTAEPVPVLSGTPPYDLLSSPDGQFSLHLLMEWRDLALSPANQIVMVEDVHLRVSGDNRF